MDLLIKWGLFLVSQALLGGSLMMLIKGTMPPPMTHKKVAPVVATGVFVVALTMMLVFGTPELLQDTIELLTK